MFVKKALVILLLVFYSASTIGATINMHYCMNKFAGYSFKEIKKDKCPKCGMKNTGCCKDEKKQIKLSADQQKVDAKISFQQHPIVIKHAFNFLEPFNRFIPFKTTWANLHAPPLLFKVNAQAFLGNFLI
ncbi:MAG: hypothetical protein RLZ95_1286 [Bacteroidota bacterium]